MNIGDVIAFADIDPVSKTIQAFTSSNVSHVAVVVDQIVSDFLIIEAATFKSGIYVGATLFSKRLIEYIKNKGSIWCLELNQDNKNKLHKEMDTFKRFLYTQLNKQYDFQGAIMAGLDNMDTIGMTISVENYDNFFCSELIASVFKKIGILPEMNCGEVTPIDLCKFSLYSGYNNILGTQKIKGFNTVADYSVFQK